MGVQLSKYKIVYTFPVLWIGWEMDNEAHIATSESGDTVLLFSNHGGFYEESATMLEEKIAEYENTLAMSQHALALLKASQPK